MAGHVHDALEILLMSFALGMDAFSLAIGIGMQGLQRRRAVQICLLIGVFHILLALLGIAAGSFLENKLGSVAQWFGAILLLGLGVMMFYSCLFGKKEENKVVGPTMFAALMFAAGVSVDALSVGFSLGLRSTAFGVVSAISFGVFGALLTGVGLFIGKRASDATGVFGELLGATILIGFGLHFLLV